jgi:putative flippase GtrA
MTRRVSVFAIVGSAGFILQLAVVAFLTLILGWPMAPATVLGVEFAVIHNFFWHERWTWADRAGDRSAVLERLVWFHLTTGATSIIGNVVIAALAAQWLHVGAVSANVVAVGIMSLANYLIADRWVFRRKLAAAVVAALVVGPASAHAAELNPQTIAAWSRYVAAAEAGLRADASNAGESEPVGRATGVEGGTVHEWRGSVFIAGITVAQLVEALTNPGTPPPQEDVIESRVLARHGDSLRVYLKLVRSAIMTVTYDTEHDVTFVRHSPLLATSRSVATKIVETGGEDHGFLWRLNSYWRYRQVKGGVQVDVVSLSLSRRVPSLAAPIVGPLVNRIARESMMRTLKAVRRFGEGLARSGGAYTKVGAAFASETTLPRGR